MNPPCPEKCQAVYFDVEKASFSALNLEGTSSTALPKSCSISCFSFGAYDNPESLGITIAILLKLSSLSGAPCPGIHRVISNASHKNGPSWICPFSSPVNLQISHGIHGSSESIFSV